MAQASLAKRLLNLPFKPFGLELTRRGAKKGPAPAAPKPQISATSASRLPQLAKLGFKPKVIFDCGAYTGHWASETAGLFPGAQMVLFEPNPRLQPVIRKNTAAIQPPPIVIEAAVGPAAGSAELNVWGNEETPGAGSSLLSHVQGEAQTKVSVKVVTIDTIAAEQNKYPDFLKLDLQGFEFPALQGASVVLQTAELCEIEFGVLEAYTDRTTPRQLIELMYDNNYTLYDIIDFLYRPYDNALTGGDFIFVKNDSPLRKYKGYK